MSTTDPIGKEILDAIREIRADLRVFRTELLQFRSEVSGRLEGIDRRLDTLTDSIADFRTEYSQHSHNN